jgi:hypothetical protein
MALQLASHEAWENIKLEFDHIPAPTTEVPVCGLCGAVLTQKSIGLHEQYHRKEN